LQGFDYRTATEDEILSRADLLEGMRIGDIPGARLTSSDPRQGRQEVGHAVEAWFGIPPNPTQGPDFPGAGIELKTIPLVKTGRGLRVKERTVISLIDFIRLGAETWDSASVRKKLRILFVFFEHLNGRSKREFPVHSVLLWEPRDEVEAQVRRDWEAVHTKVLAGLAHELTETDGRILGPCTKGADSRVFRPQPYSTVRAKSRAFALKPSFTFSLYVEPAAHLDEDALAENADLGQLRTAFTRFEGRTIDEVALELGIRPSNSKSYAANVVHTAVRAASPLSSEDFKLIGPTVKMTRIDASAYPYEAMSFPAFRHLDLIRETWDDSEFLSLVEHMIIVPVFGAERSTPAGNCVIQEPVYWEPTAAQLEVIQREWEDFHDRIKRGGAAALPTEGQTSAIHVRPHGRNAADLDAAPGGGSQTKKSFWLNRRFVQEILTSN
jgi:DNA mismatch repair endonuclease MutH